MKKLLASLGLAAFVFAFAPDASAREQEDDHGKHKGWYKHGDDDDDDNYRHDNGKHKGWYKHHGRGDYDDWDYDGERIRPGYYYPRGRYPYIRHVIVVRGFDPRTRHIILYDQSNRSEEHTSELQSHSDLVCRLLLEKKNNDQEPQ